MADVKIRVVELMDRVLSSFDHKVGDYTSNMFRKEGEDMTMVARIKNLAGCSIFKIDHCTASGMCTARGMISSIL